MKLRYYILIVVVVLSLASIACDDGMDMSGDMPRLGDAMKIGEKLEETVCTSQGGHWNDHTNTCK